MNDAISIGRLNGGGLFAVFNNAGVGDVVPLEFVPLGKFIQVFDGMEREFSARDILACQARFVAGSYIAHLTSAVRSAARKN